MTTLMTNLTTLYSPFGYWTDPIERQYVYCAFTYDGVIFRNSNN